MTCASALPLPVNSLCEGYKVMDRMVAGIFEAAPS
jgi:hypothetical protein